jgi:hypothetical protein
MTSEFQRWYPPRDLSVESIPNRKSKILKPPHLSVASISNLKSQISNLKSINLGLQAIPYPSGTPAGNGIASLARTLI